MKTITNWSVISLFIVSGLGSIIVFSSELAAQESKEFTIDEEGNIILIEKEAPAKKPNPKPEPKAQEAKPKKTAPPAVKQAKPKPTPAPKPQAPKIQEAKPAPAEASPPPQAKPEPEVIDPPTEFPYARYPQKYPAFVITKTAKAYTKPEANSALALQLRQGDEMKVSGESGDFYRMEYLIDGEFLVEAWILKAQVKPVRNPALIPDKPSPQDYTPDQRQEAVVTKVEDVPELKVARKVELKEEKGQKKKKRSTETKSRKIPKAKPSVRVKDKKRSSKRKQGPLAWNLGLNIGFSKLEDKVKTATEASTNQIEFLDYQLNGFMAQAEGEVTYEVQPRLRVGAKASYLFEILTSSIPSGSSTINNSGVTAQFHDIALGPLVEYEFIFPEVGIKFKPDLWLSGHMQIFNPNQLQDSVRAQPVLFGHLAFYGRALMSPKAEFPYGLSLRPQLGAVFMYSFKESPTQQVAINTGETASIRTGSPKTTAFALQYGGELAWGLQVLGFKNNEFFFRGFYKSFPRKFSGTGNRAGIQTQNAESDLEKTELGVGYRHFF